MSIVRFFLSNFKLVFYGFRIRKTLFCCPMTFWIQGNSVLVHHVKNWEKIANMSSWLYTTGNFVTKTLFTTFQKSHWLKFARCLCNAESRCLSTTDFRRWSKSQNYQNHHRPQGMWMMDWCQIGRKVGTCLLGWRNSARFHHVFYR